LLELKGRFEHIVFGGIRTNVKEQYDCVSIRRFAGNLTVCRGLCSELESDISEEHKRAEKDVGTEDF